MVQTILPPSVQINASAPQYLQRPSTSRPNSERKKRLMALAIGQPSFLTNLGYGVAETAKLCNLYFGILLAPSNDIIIKFYNLFNTYFQFIFQSSQINKIHIVPVSGQKKVGGLSQRETTNIKSCTLEHIRFSCVPRKKSGKDGSSFLLPRFHSISLSVNGESLFFR